MTNRVSLTELAAADIKLRPDEAVALVIEICRQHAAGVLVVMPSPGIIRFTSDGRVVVEGPMATEEPTVARAAHLLNELLPDCAIRSNHRASGGLRLVIARAVRTLDLPPYDTLADFAAALQRFAVPDLGAAARKLFCTWEKAHATRAWIGAPELTISDVRRARRATGLSLDDLAAVAEVPAERLRELEWGYLRQWRPDDESRAQVVRYARAAGLDEQLVVSIVWPLIELAVPAVAVGADAVDADAVAAAAVDGDAGAGAADANGDAGEMETATALVLARPRPLKVIADSAPPRHGRTVIASWALALAAAAAGLVGFATFGLIAEPAQGAARPVALGFVQTASVPAQASSQPVERGAETSAQPVERGEATSPQPRERGEASAPMLLEGGEARVLPASSTSTLAPTPVPAMKPALAPMPAVRRAAARHAAAAASSRRRPGGHPTPFLERELFRIVFR